jgi:hypothetical protein
MTTFTTEDRIIAEKDGSLTVNVNAGEVTFVNKDLTDNEIWKLWELFDPSQDAWVSEEQVIGFARAMLKKAQEK